MLDQQTKAMRTRRSLCRIFTLALPLIGLSGCIPEHIKDVEWCRNIETAKTLIDDRGKANLTTAMAKNKCAAKLLEAKKLAEKRAAELKASKTSSDKAKRPAKNPNNR